MISIGIDPGLTNAGLVVIGHDRTVLVAEVFHGPRQKDREQDLQVRLAELLAWAQRLVAPHVSYTDAIAAVECPMIGGRREDTARPGSARAQAETFAAWAGLFGMLRSQVAEFYAPLPVSWRAAVRPHAMTTEQLHRHLDRRWGITERVWRASKTPHAIDAAGIAEYGLQQHVAARAPPTARTPARSRRSA